MKYKIFGIRGSLVENTRGRFWYRFAYNKPCPIPVFMEDGKPMFELRNAKYSDKLIFPLCDRKSPTHLFYYEI